MEKDHIKERGGGSSWERRQGMDTASHREGRRGRTQIKVEVGKEGKGKIAKRDGVGDVEKYLLQNVNLGRVENGRTDREGNL
jgi:hypothetical protein